MRKLVLVVIALLALFALLRAYSQGNGESGGVTGIRLQPGLVEVGDGTVSLGLSFGLMEGSGGERKVVSVLPLRIVYRDGEKSVTIGLNGFAFLLGGGARVGTPVVVSSPRRGDLLSVGGRVRVDSRVDGDVWVLGADAELSPHAVVTGDVVVIGGKLLASRGAAVGGMVSQLAGLKIPFVGVLGTQFAAPALSLGAVAVGYALCGVALFMSAFYLSAHARQMQQSFPTLWRPALITVAISLVAIPFLAALCIASVVGVLFLPALVVAMFLLALDGFLALCIRVGVWIRASGARGADPSLYLFTSGLLSLFLVNVPAIVGILLSSLRFQAAALIGTLLQALSLWLTAAGFVYGFGASLAHARLRVPR
jgi:hypothetical protein